MPKVCKLSLNSLVIVRFCQHADTKLLSRWCQCLAGLASACCAAALSLPYVADLMAFVGALLTMSISLIIPALMHAVLLRKQLPWWAMLLDGAVLLLGVACASVGASSAYQSLQLKLIMAAAA
eukprot:GHRQ01013824.1.p5 GENE.GHRQ01013824.1~~GHRQ01013824.1.p5  ORF type:complete len:123 (+),score=38.29 GHRQ01013824.1:1227-1595(+)